MTEEEMIAAFRYEGYDISNYLNNMLIVNTDESGFIDNNKQAIVTARTFSCANILFYNKDFAYLVHMFPSETVGRNNKFETRINKVKKIFLEKKPSEVNILISLGSSVDYLKNMNFHNLDHINSKLNILVDFCNENEIVLNILPTIRSKNLLFDLNNQLLYSEFKKQEPIEISLLEEHKNILTDFQSKKHK